jgi:hypothetical protein
MMAIAASTLHGKIHSNAGRAPHHDKAIPKSSKGKSVTLAIDRALLSWPANLHENLSESLNLPEEDAAGMFRSTGDLDYGYLRLQ